MKQRIRLTESDLHNMVKESLKKILNEEDNLNEYALYAQKLINEYEDGNITEDFLRRLIKFEKNAVKLFRTRAYKSIGKKTLNILNKMEDVFGIEYLKIYDEINNMTQSDEYYNQYETRFLKK